MLAEQIPRHTDSDNQDLAWLPRPQQEVAIMHSNNFDTGLNSASAGMVATKSSQDISVQLILFNTIYTNYNHKLLAKVRKLTIPWDKFKGLALKRGFKIS